MNLMTRGNQTRHQRLSNRSRRTSHKHSHHGLLERGINYTPYDETAALAVTPPSTQHGERLLLSATPRIAAQASANGSAAVASASSVSSTAQSEVRSARTTR